MHDVALPDSATRDGNTLDVATRPDSAVDDDVHVSPDSGAIEDGSTPSDSGPGEDGQAVEDGSALEDGAGLVPDVLFLVPDNNEVTGWTEDTSIGQAGVEVATNRQEAESLINGDADFFLSADAVALARQHYEKGSYTLELRVWQMPSDAACTSLYDAIVVDNALYSGQVWTDALGAEVARIADTGARWWLNARKGVYYIEASIEPNDANGRIEVENFALAVLSRL